MLKRDEYSGIVAFLIQIGWSTEVVTHFYAINIIFYYKEETPKEKLFVKLIGKK